MHTMDTMDTSDMVDTMDTMATTLGGNVLDTMNTRIRGGEGEAGQ